VTPTQKTLWVMGKWVLFSEEVVDVSGKNFKKITIQPRVVIESQNYKVTRLFYERQKILKVEGINLEKVLNETC
jgi:hypothetical protein